MHHLRHSLARTVALFKDEAFPRCSECDSEVLFTMWRAMPGLDSIRDLQVRVSLKVLHPAMPLPTTEALP